MLKSTLVVKEVVASVNGQDSLSEKKTLTFLDRNIRKGNLLDLPEIHSEFAGLLPVDEDSYSALEEMAVRDGKINSSIMTCIIDGVEYVLDGHIRLDVAIKKGIEDFTIETLSHIKTVEEGICWIVFNACSHRKLNKAQRVALVRKLKPMLKAIAKANQKLGAELKGAFSKTEKAGKRVHVAKELARMAGTSPDFFSDTDYVLEHGKPEEKKMLLEKGFGASTLRKKIEIRLAPPDPEPEIIPYSNPKEGDYINQVIQGDCIQVLKDMHYHGINNIAALITSIPYNVGLNYQGYSDDMQYDEYLEFIALTIYHAQRLGRDGMRICINLATTTNTDVSCTKNNLFKDICNKVDELNAKYDDCNLVFWGDIFWYKNHTNAPPFLGSYGSPSSPFLRNDGEYILVWAKNCVKLENIHGTNCDAGDSSIFSDKEREKYILTKKEYEKFTLQTWPIAPCTDKKLLKSHPCPFPDEIPYRLLKLLTYPQDTILDCFMGSGVTCKIAKQLKRKFVGIDQCSNYCNDAKELIDTDAA